MNDFPTGTVTFLFTDVEGSTKLLHQIGSHAYSKALADHRRVVREACARHGGVEIDTQGDAFFVVFSSAASALEAAEEAQAALAPSRIRVRAGVHTGTALVTEEGYVGPDVHKGARIGAAGHGGQVLLSKETRELAEVEVTDLGEHRLKDFAEPVWIFQLGDERFPPLKTISNTNLPRPASSFVGREKEVSEIASLLQEEARLLTLTGAGGSGKTRLAIEAAAEIVSGFRNGVFWISLAALKDPALVTDTVAQTLGAKDGLAAHIGGRELLLALDNFEQVVESAPQLPGLLETCPNLRLLVTSRELLRVRGEVEYAVPPLAEPEAIELFCTRSGDEPDETIAELCRNLDNLPLAVELAAARTRVLSPVQILERLSGRLDLFKAGRDAEARQATLRATIEWSYDLLSEREKALFARLAVFSGGCTLDAAEEVVGADLDTMQSVVDKSLLFRVADRFWMLATIHEFAAELLDKSEEADNLRARHADQILTLVEAGAPMLHGGEQRIWLERIALEQENIRSALGWSLREKSETALRLAASASWFWQMRSHLEEGRLWTERALAAAPTASPPLRASALDGGGRLAYYGGDIQGARGLLEHAVSNWRACQDRVGLARSLTYVGIVAGDEGEGLVAGAAGEEAVAVSRDADDWTRAMALWALGTNHVLERCDGADLDTGRLLLQEAVALFRQIGDIWGLGAPLYYLAMIAMDEGNLAVARVRLAEAISSFRAIGDKWRLSAALTMAGEVAVGEDLPDEARRLYAEAIPLLKDLGDEGATREILGRIAEIDRGC